MGALLGPASLLLLEALGLALLPLGIEGPLTTSKAAEGSSLHSLHYFFTFLSEPGEGFPQFIALGYIDNQLFYQYDSNSRKVQPRVSWMEKVDAQYWDTQTKMMQGKESEFRGHMGTLSNYYNHSEGSTSHSLRYFRTSVSQPGQGLPQFFIVGYVDDQLFYQYDSNSKKARPRVTWMENAGAHYWDTETQFMRDREAVSRAYMANLRNHYNQSGEFHTLQKMFGCELRKDGSTGGFAKYAYDGTDHTILDKETLTWTADDGSSQISKKEWETIRTPAQTCKAYLEEECIKRLQKFLNYGKEALLRTELPVGKVTRQAIGGGQEALICQAYGFYPKEIDATWRKGEEILEHETFRRNIAPNSDGTYHIWLSIEIDPKERNLYQCHVDHASLQKPLVLTFEEPGVNVGLILAIFGVVAAFLLAAGITIFFFFKNRHKKGDYKAASTSSDKSSDISIRE